MIMFIPVQNKLLGLVVLFNVNLSLTNLLTWLWIKEVLKFKYKTPESDSMDALGTWAMHLLIFEQPSSVEDLLNGTG
jgi:hypothetical protein